MTLREKMADTRTAIRNRDWAKAITGLVNIAANLGSEMNDTEAHDLGVLTGNLVGEIEKATTKGTN